MLLSLNMSPENDELRKREQLEEKIEASDEYRATEIVKLRARGTTIKSISRTRSPRCSVDETSNSKIQAEAAEARAAGAEERKTRPA